MKVLLVEDEHKIAHSIKKGLLQEGYVVTVAYDGQTGLDEALDGSYDLIILDWLLPLKDGLTVCKELRQEKIHTPILMLTARSQTADKVTGLNSGADDYLTKPFAFEELLARIRALIRRPQEVLSTILKVEDLTLDPVNFEVRRQEQLINLSGKEFALLEYLMRHSHKILSKDQLIDHVWNYDSDVLPNTVEVYIGYLRNKVDKPFTNSPTLIQTVRGFGYKLGLN